LSLQVQYIFSNITDGCKEQTSHQFHSSYISNKVRLSSFSLPTIYSDSKSILSTGHGYQTIALFL